MTSSVIRGVFLKYDDGKYQITGKGKLGQKEHTIVVGEYAENLRN